MERRARIAGTLGPACDDEATIERMLRAGLDVARLNFSHGTAAEHRRRAERLRRSAAAAGREVALLADLQGPRFRLGRLRGGSRELEAGSAVDLLAGASVARGAELPVAYAALARDVRRGDTVLIDDGKVELKVDRVRGEAVRCTVVRGGTVSDRKGINLPGVEVSVPTIGPKDRRDLRLAVDLAADWLAVSFVRRAEDVRRARRLLARAGGGDVPVMAKIERREAIDRLDEILDEADGVLVARGDLGVELPPEEVPVLQKQIIRAANARGRAVMTATQMLDSMRHAERPTRAEASDVANAVLDGSDALLLTAETAAGDFPVEVVATMDRIIRRAERAGLVVRAGEPAGELSVPVATAHAACRAAADVGASHLVAFTCSGSTAQQLSRFRPAMPIVACTPSQAVARRLQVWWGVRAVVVPDYDRIEEMIGAVDRALLERRIVSRGAVVVVLGGAPIGVPGTTNLIKLHRVGSRTDAGAGRRRRSRRG